SSHVDRFTSADDSELNVESLIENLKNVIIKKLSVSCVTESFISLLISSAALQSSTLASVSDSSPAIPVPATLTSATSGFTASAFVISSSHFKKMLYRLNESPLSASWSQTLIITFAKDICVFRNRNTDVILFYTRGCETHMS
ncbi:hypothetical protein BDDG_13517, partial [Blastomyces dermatitidis ATCC 18188]